MPVIRQPFVKQMPPIAAFKVYTVENTPLQSLALTFSSVVRYPFPSRLDFENALFSPGSHQI